MEAYLPVCKYAELTGLAKNTIHRRAIRGSVESFKNHEGRWFIYYCDDKTEIPEGYLTVKEFAEKVGKSKTTIHHYIDMGYISKDNIIIQKQQPSAVLGMQPRVFIKEDAAIIGQKPSEEYLTIAEWALKEGVSIYSVRNWIAEYLLPYEKSSSGKRFYIHKKYTIDDVARERDERSKNRKEWLQKVMQEMQK